MIKKISKLLLLSAILLVISVISAFIHTSLGGGECFPINEIESSSDNVCQIRDTIFMPISIISFILAFVFGIFYLSLKVILLNFKKTK